MHILRYDVDRSGFIDMMELKLMMEKLGEPQTHLGLKAMIKEVDEDNDGEISFREVCTYMYMCDRVNLCLLCMIYTYARLCLGGRGNSPLSSADLLNP